MITKKTYIKAAKIVNNKRSLARDYNRHITLFLRDQEEVRASEIEKAFIELFCGDNPRFNKERFKKACQPESNR